MEALPDGLLFGFISAVFAAIGAYLVFGIVENNIDGKTFAWFYGPLLLCWLGIWKTIGGPDNLIAWALAGLALSWCAFVALRSATLGRKVEQDFSNERIAAFRKWTQERPGDPFGHFKLAEQYEDRGWRREAYEEYLTALQLDPKHRLARFRARELYREITGKIVPEGEMVPDTGGPASPTAPATGSSPPPVPLDAAGTSGPVPDMRTHSGEAFPPLGGNVTTLPIFEPTALPGSDAAIARTHGIASMSPDVGSEPVNFDPTISAPGWARLGQEMLKNGRPDEAAEYYRRALTLDPQNERYRSNLLALSDVGAGTHEKTESVRAVSDPTPSDAP